MGLTEDDVAELTWYQPSEEVGPVGLPDEFFGDLCEGTGDSSLNLSSEGSSTLSSASRTSRSKHSDLWTQSEGCTRVTLLTMLQNAKYRESRNDSQTLALAVILAGKFA